MACIEREDILAYFRYGFHDQNDLMNIRKALSCAAIGSALGHAVETGRCGDIDARFGTEGFLESELDPASGKALVSGGFLEMLFVLNALIAGRTHEILCGGTADMEASIRRGMMDFTVCQTSGEPPADNICWISRLEETRIPRHANAGAARSRSENGCMLRMIPIALINRYPADLIDIARMGDRAASITHGKAKTRRYAAAFTHSLSQLTWRSYKQLGLYCTLWNCKDDMKRLYAGKWTMNIDKMWEISQRSDENLPRADQVNRNPNPRDALYISMACCTKYSLDFTRAITAAARHGSTAAAMTGCIWGLQHGMMTNDDKWLERLELKETIEELARDLHAASKLQPGAALSPDWLRKYANHRPIETRESANAAASTPPGSANMFPTAGADAPDLKEVFA